MYRSHCTVLPPRSIPVLQKTRTKVGGTLVVVSNCLIPNSQRDWAHHVALPLRLKTTTPTATEGGYPTRRKKRLEGGELSVLPFANWAVGPLQALQGPLRIGERLEWLSLVTRCHINQWQKRRGAEHAPYCGAGAQPTRIPEEQKLLDWNPLVSWTSDSRVGGVYHAAS